MTSQELGALKELILMLVLDPRIVALFTLLIIASVFDYKSQRIPNWLVASGLVYALVYAIGYSIYYDVEFFSSKDINLLWSLKGLLIGFVLFLPLYIFRAMGAGDVKLMAMVGAFVGFPTIIYAVLYSCIVGGVLAITVTLLNGTIFKMFTNIYSTLQLAAVDVATGTKPSMEIKTSVGKLPYGIAIMIGTIGYVVLHHLGFL